ncbi:MAG: glycoside hydrolase family 2 [Bacteroidales bacterium]|jgi:beta-mannosidase|nr:glycoside hydrolase family 2 [Bacteroidales bacterium]
MNRFFSLFFVFIVGCYVEGASQQIVSLNGEWELTYWEQGEAPVREPDKIGQVKTNQIKAHVPGNVELDLLAAGLIKDPMIGNNVYDLRPYEGYQWCYSKRFASPSVTDGQRIVLFFGGIDCLADIWLNGVKIGAVDNMFVEHTFDVTSRLTADGENLLQVIIRSAVSEGMEYLLGVFSFGGAPESESINIRKAPHSYGWDIMPRLVSAGLWRGVELRVLNHAYITDVFWMTTQIDTAARTASGHVDVQVKMPFNCLDKLNVAVSLSYKGKKVYQIKGTMLSHASPIPFAVTKDAELWWPRGYGEPSLYDAEVQLVDENGKVLSVDKRRIGLRTVELDRSELNDANGRFCFIVNGEKIFVRGTNWVPLDGFHSRDASWVKSTLDMVTDLNCNMVRCWGGNVYEDHDFFDICDERGMLVWQDFAMACIFYPQNDVFARQIEQEVRAVVLKLRNHPSIALWSGNNEDDQSFYWSLKNFNLNPNRDRISRMVIPHVLFEFDPTRPYLPSSPYYSQQVYERGGNDDDLPENHLWGPRGYYKAPFYTTAKARFVSEIGYHGCPNKESLEKMFSKKAVYPWVNGFEWNDEWLTKAVRTMPASGKFAGRNDLMLNQVKLLFGDVPTDLNAFIERSQAVQAEAMKYFVEKWRGDKFSRTGIIWWNVRDGWPILSDAVVDYYNSKKLAYHFLKQVQYNECVFLNDPVNGSYPLVVANDTRKPAKGNVTVTDMASGKELYKGSFEVNANDRLLIASIPQQNGQGMLYIQYEMNGERRLNHYLYGDPPFSFENYKRLLQKTKIYQ